MNQMPALAARLSGFDEARGYVSDSNPSAVPYGRFHLGLITADGCRPCIARIRQRLGP